MRAADRYPLLLWPYDLLAAAPGLTAVVVGNALPLGSLLDAVAEGTKADAALAVRIMEPADQVRAPQRS